MPKAWLGMGGNMGDVCASLEQALKKLNAAKGVELISVSSFYKTPPWGKTDQNYFINLCCCVKTHLEPEDLLRLCLELEQQLGRVREEKWGPRIIDIDVLAYEGVEKYNSKDLTLPHPFMTERSFVLQPLSEIAANLVVFGKTIAQWAKENLDNEIVILSNKPNIL